ncbi:TolC family outer membrane protein [Salipiger marinus]|jgi:outer membrane protein|uniref:Outer membrane protein n=1 Tax=Salipiger marinus TaxID=555512 RepID=A0A1G8JP63_9RHOB|nr:MULTISPECIES: TolC family outer membrane protein [Salipiger]HBM57885.1 transporter [Citreicella sp.]MCD1619999.1 TolC family outer membrane protein [Salipiger manganoxidans]MEB3420945.1 TolC family outer membrane protein [Salipiger manganoxidans]SDI33008.1 outer membrane protein [Salipiger marinus]HBT02606.1 transporter [Citreicella sp.]
MARRTLKGMIAGVCLAAASVGPVTAETLAEALVGAYNTSGLLEQNRAVLRAADEDVAQSVAALRPVIAWSSDVTRSFSDTRSAATLSSVSNTASLGLSATLTLFDGGNNRLSLEGAKESVLATRAALVSIEQEVMLRGVQAFMEVVRATEALQLRQNNVRVIGEELRAAEDRFEVGEVTRTDVAAAEARLAEARALLASAEGSLDIAREEYLAVVGRYPGTLVEPQALPTLPANVEAAKSQALRNHPDMSQAQHQVTAAEIGIAIAEAARRPTVSLRGSYGLDENFDNDNRQIGGTIGLQAEGPIYSGGALSSSRRQAMAVRDQNRAQLLQVSQIVPQNVGTAYAQLRVARASISASSEQVRAAGVAFDGIREEATLGARTTLDVLDAEQELLDARNALISSEVDETIAAYTVLATLGLLTAESLQLNVPRYDPAEYYNLVKSAPVQSRQGADLDRILNALGRE